MKKHLATFLLVVLVSSLFSVSTASANDLSEKLKGRILIEVEGDGELWYLNPINMNRYYLGGTNGVFNIMSRLALGISNKDFDSLDKLKLKKLAGKILLKVEDSGRAYYINPLDLELYYLGDPKEAYDTLKGLSVGISDYDLEKIIESPLQIAGFDSLVNPEDNFFKFVNGGWIKNTAIPSDKSSMSNFSILRDRSALRLKEILEISDSERGLRTGEIRKTLDFYYTGMNTEKIEAEGLGLLEDEFNKINKISNLDDFSTYLASMHSSVATPLFEIYAYSDPDDSNMNIAEIWQARLSLPNKDYYLEDDDDNIKTRSLYLDYLKNSFLLLGDSEESALKNANIVLNLETGIAKNFKSRNELRDSDGTNNKINLEKLKEISPNIKWDIYLEAINLGDPGDINISGLNFIKGISDLLAGREIEEWKVYLKYYALNKNASYLGDKYVNNQFDFYSKHLDGKEVRQERWKDVVYRTNSFLGMPLGKLYSQKYFPEVAKEKMLGLVENLRTSFRERIEKIEWMSLETKEEAYKKLDAFRVKIGYPDVWPDYSNLEIKDDSYLANVFRAREFNFKKDIRDIGEVVDKEKWYMNPQDVNAYYSSAGNEIVFPAGILQSPFFDLNADDAMNYGGIGMVIGHEMTHGFDDQGRKYDSKGNFNDWWKESDSEKFNEKSKLLVDMFSKFSPLPGIYVDGELTLGENIADLGGLVISYNAFMDSLEGKDKTIIDGYSPEQRFFISYAQIWKGKFRDEYLKYIVKSDPHTPTEYRVNGPLSNFSEFQKAFNLNSESPMIRSESERISIW